MQQHAQSSQVVLDRYLLHRRLGHISQDRLESLLKNKLVVNLKLDSETPMSGLCDACILGKQHRSLFPQQAENRHSLPLDLIFSDVHGPLPTQTVQGYRYWITFLDDATKYCQVVLLKKKSEAFQAFQIYRASSENLHHRKIGTLRDDKGGEYISKDWDDYMKLHGIRREHTVRSTPQQNGAAERINRTLAEGVTAMLVESHLPASFWGEALATFLYVRNRSPTSSLPSTATPYELWHSKKPSISHLRVFGCRAYVHVQKDQRKSLQPHSLKCIFLGYPEGYKGWKCYDPLSKKVVISRDVIFDECSFPGLVVKESQLTESSPSHTPVDQNFIQKILVPWDDSDDQDSVGALPQVPAGQPLAQHKLPQLTPSPPPEVKEEPLLHDILQSQSQSPSPDPDPDFISPAPHMDPSPAPSSSSSPSPFPVRRAPRRRKEPVPPNPPSPYPTDPAVRRSTRASKKPGEWWKVDFSTLHKSKSAEPTNEEEETQEGDGETIYEEAQEYQEAEVSQEALMFQGLDYVYPSETDMDLTTALEFAFNTRVTSATDEPSTFSEAMRRPDADLWYKAATDEIQSHLENGTWTLATLPKDQKAIGCKWVFKVKRNPDGSVERYKARLVAKGFSQRPGLEYDETFASTLKWSTLRIIFAIAAMEVFTLK